MPNEVTSTQLQAPLPLSGKSSWRRVTLHAIVGLILGGIAALLAEFSAAKIIGFAVGLALLWAGLEGGGRLKRATLCGLAGLATCLFLVKGLDWLPFSYFLLWGILGVLGAIPPGRKLWWLQVTVAACLGAVGLVWLAAGAGAIITGQAEVTVSVLFGILLIVVGTGTGAVVLVRLLKPLKVLLKPLILEPPAQQEDDDAGKRLLADKGHGLGSGPPP
jgi:hypothetical protein